MVSHVLCEVRLGGRDFAILRREVDQATTRTVGGCVEHLVIQKYGRGDVCCSVRSSRVPPKRLAVGCTDANAGFGGKRNVSPHASDIGRDSGGISCLVAEALAGPNGLAGCFVEGDHCRVTSAWRNNHAIAIDERRLADQPLDI